MRYPSSGVAVTRSWAGAMHIKKIGAGILTALLSIAMTLAAMYVLVRATLMVAQIPGTLARAIAIAAELVLGVILLVGTTWLTTHLAVRIFGGGAGRALPPR